MSETNGINKWGYLAEHIFTYMLHSREATNQEILSFLREERLVERPSSKILDFIDKTRIYFIKVSGKGE